MSRKRTSNLPTVSLLVLLGLVLAAGLSFGQLDLNSRAQTPTHQIGEGGDNGGGDPDNPVPFTGGEGGDSYTFDGVIFESQAVDPALSRNVWDELLVVWAGVSGALDPILRF